MGKVHSWLCSSPQWQWLMGFFVKQVTYYIRATVLLSQAPIRCLQHATYAVIFLGVTSPFLFYTVTKGSEFDLWGFTELISCINTSLFIVYFLPVFSKHIFHSHHFSVLLYFIYLNENNCSYVLKLILVISFWWTW